MGLSLYHMVYFCRERLNRHGERKIEKTVCLDIQNHGKDSPSKTQTSIKEITVAGLLLQEQDREATTTRKPVLLAKGTLLNRRNIYFSLAMLLRSFPCLGE